MKNAKYLKKYLKVSRYLKSMGEGDAFIKG